MGTGGKGGGFVLELYSDHVSPEKRRTSKFEK